MAQHRRFDGDGNVILEERVEPVRRRRPQVVTSSAGRAETRFGGRAETDAAAVVTCHNYGRYLRQCVESLVGQVTPFREIVIVDDASDDDTPAVGAELATQHATVRYERIEARSVAAGRNRGMELTTAPLVAFIDADNWLGPTWLADLMELTRDWDAAIFFAAPQAVDDSGNVLGVPKYVQPFDYWGLRRDNHIDTCSLVRRVAIEQAGGWQPTPEGVGMEDWSMWLRITRDGWGAHVLERPNWYYRRHPAQISRREPRGVREHVAVMAQTFHLAVVMPLSGRGWMVHKLPQVWESVGWPAERAHGIFIDNSCDEDYGKKLRRLVDLYCCDWASYAVVRDPTETSTVASNSELADSAELRRQNLVRLADTMCRLYARTAQRLLGEGIDLVLTIEDDIEPIGGDVAMRLLEGMEPDVMAVSGVVHSRFTPEGAGPAVITYDVASDEPYRLQRVPDEPDATHIRDVDASGMGCLLTRAEVWHRHMPRRRGVHNSRQHLWHDMAISENVRRAGYRWRLHYGVRANHWYQTGEYSEDYV